MCRYYINTWEVNNPMYFIIYKTTHINGKYYVGRHITKDLNDTYFGSGKWIRSIKDKSTLSKEILLYCENEDQLKAEEKIYIAQHIDDPLNMNYNNNSCGFASGDLNYNRTLEGRERCRERVLGVKNPMYGKTHTEAAKKTISEKLTGELNPFFQKTHSDKTKSYMSEIKMGKSLSEIHIEHIINARKKQYKEKGLPKNFNFRGKKHDESSKKLLSEKALQRTNVKCVYCGKETKPHTAKRWHGENCKYKD